MRLLKDKRGGARMIEAFLAAMMLLSCLTLVPTQPTHRDTNINLNAKAENVLLSLDCDGHLGKLIDQRDWRALGTCLEAALPITVWFNLTVLDSDMHALNEYPICNGGAVNDEIVSVEYICVSQNNLFAMYILKLQLAVAN
ncbi:MAG: hypothetical protein NWE98_01310 [Candidatus Bathyarchaeota archaeon]|nr:hypothetical protein [Candidatus Bathyarchaeota archaeon]